MNAWPNQCISAIESTRSTLGHRPFSMQAGEMGATFAGVSDLPTASTSKPDMPIEVGIARFVAWYKD